MKARFSLMKPKKEPSFVLCFIEINRASLHCITFISMQTKAKRTLPDGVVRVAYLMNKHKRMKEMKERVVYSIK